MFVLDIKKITYRFCFKQPMRMIERKMMRRFIKGKAVNCRYQYRWLPDCILNPLLDCSSRFRAPYSFRSRNLELQTM